MFNRLKLVIWDIIKGYFLELIIASISIAQAFIDAELVENNRLVVASLGIFLALISVISKIREGYHSRSTHELIEDLSTSVNERDEQIQEAQELIRKQHQTTEARSKELEEQNILISRLIKEGLISEKDIFEIVLKDRLILLFCYQNVPDQNNIQKNILKKDFRNPSLEAVEEIGFVKVGTRSNLYVIPVNMLPKKLRSVEKIEKLLKKLVKDKWSTFLKELHTADKKYFNDYVEKGDPTNCTYMITASNFHDLIIDEVGYNSFSSKFKNMLKYNVDIKKLRREISKRKHAIREFVKSISYELLLSDISVKKDIPVLQSSMDRISKKLGISNFLEFRDREADLKVEFSELFTEQKATKYSKSVARKSKKYCDLFYVLGIKL